MWNRSLSFLVAAASLACSTRQQFSAAEGGMQTDVAPAKQSSSFRAKQVVQFWRDAGPSLWFAKEPDFDRRFKDRFLALHEAAARGDLADWIETPEGALALCILLDQFPRNGFRGTPRMYATDELAREIAQQAISRGHDRVLDRPLALFVYLPFAHSENLADQERSVDLAKRLGAPHVEHAEHHRDIVKRFGRFPHRNPILGRMMRPEEQRYLDEGGFKG